MKIGIISINMHTKTLNFACPLHTWAFQTVLSQLGYESVILDYYPIYYGNFNSREPYETYCRSYERKWNQLQDPELSPEDRTRFEAQLEDLLVKREGFKQLIEERKIRYDRFEDFFRKYYRKTEESYDSGLLEFHDPGCDAYVCVTDVIWELKYARGKDQFDRGFFLGSSTMDGKPKIAYAASRDYFGGYDELQKECFLGLTEDVDFISGREKEMELWFRENAGRETETVLDPVLLLDAQQYREIAVKPKEEKYLLFYYVMENAPDVVEFTKEYARLHDLKIIELSDRAYSVEDQDSVTRIYRYDVSPEEWLGYILHADLVCTNSFHACCFSVLFEKKFFYGERRGEKIPNLVNALQLTERAITNLSRQDWDKPIDYERVNRLLNEHRERSMAFLKNALAESEKLQGKKTVGAYLEKSRREQEFPIYYRGKHKKMADPAVCSQKMTEEGSYRELKNNSLEWNNGGVIKNDETCRLEESMFWVPGYRLKGWYLSVRLGKYRLWYMENGCLESMDDFPDDKEAFRERRKIFRPGAVIPHFPVHEIRHVIAEAIFEPDPAQIRFSMVYHSGKNYSDPVTAEAIGLREVESDAEVKITKTMAKEIKEESSIGNDGSYVLGSCPFVQKGYLFKGWNLRVKSEGKWIWLMADGTISSRPKEMDQEVFDSGKKILMPGEQIPVLDLPKFDVAAAVAMWEEEPSPALTDRIRRLFFKK